MLIKEYPEFKEITGLIHSGTTMNINENLCLFDEKNMYIITNKPDYKITVYPNIYCIGLNTFNKSYNYALCQDKADSETPGLRIFDLESIIKRNEPGMILMKDIDIGTVGAIDWSYSLVRLGMMKSMTHVIVMPILHRSSNKFMGIKALDKYITYKLNKGRLYAL